jgi:hypothetical protein
MSALWRVFAINFTLTDFKALRHKALRHNGLNIFCASLLRLGIGIALALGHLGNHAKQNHYIERVNMSKDKKNTTDKVNTTEKASTLSHVAAPSKMGTLFPKNTTKTASLTDLHLHKFQIIEGESALAKNREPLLTAFADGINWPFRTKVEKINNVDTTIIQISSGWVKQHSNDLTTILAHFKAFCLNGHLVTPTITSAFDTTFQRPGYHYTCPGCGAVMVTSYRLVTEAEKRGCIPCMIPASQMSCVKVS